MGYKSLCFLHLVGTGPFPLCGYYFSWEFPYKLGARAYVSRESLQGSAGKAVGSGCIRALVSRTNPFPEVLGSNAMFG